MMSQLLQDFKLELEPITDNGETRHHTTMTFFENGLTTNYKDSYTLDELENIEFALVDILYKISKYRNSQRAENETINN